MKLFSPDFLSSLAKFANVLIVAAFEMVWHEALADVLEKGKVVIADDADGSDDAESGLMELPGARSPRRQAEFVVVQLLPAVVGITSAPARLPQGQAAAKTS